jgi:Outer membrane protein beta-barrel domain
MRFRYLVVAAALLMPGTASAEWQIKPFLGLTLGGGTTFLDLEEAAGDPNFVYGASVQWLGDIFGVEGDVGFGPGFFESGDQTIVTDSEVTTVTGSVVVALPRRATQYTLRPYLVGGFGLMHVRKADPANVFDPTTNLAAINVGGGATGFLTDRVGLSWELRYFRNVSGPDVESGVTFGEARLSFWRATMAVVFR